MRGQMFNSIAFPACRRVVLGAWLTWLATAALATRARADDAVDEGVAQFAAADFHGALASFARAERGHELTKDSLSRLLATRALVHSALGDAPAAEADLAALAALAPQHRFGPEAPPELIARFRALATNSDPLGLEVRASRNPGGVRIDAEVTGTGRGLVRRVVVFARAGDAPAFTQAEERLVLYLPRPVDVAYFAELRGPGDALLARAGSAARPRVLPSLQATAAAPAAQPPAAPPPRRPDAPRRTRRKWIGWIAGGVALVGGAVLAAVLIRRHRDDRGGLTPID